MLALMASIQAKAQWTNSASAVFLNAANANSNVGIGTNAPAEKLQVAGNTRLNGRLAVIHKTTDDLVDFVNQSNNVGNGSSILWVAYDWATSQPNNPMLIQASTREHSRFVVRNDGQVFIGDVDVNANGLTPEKYRLYVEKGILTEKVKVALKTTADWSDFVFEDNYPLATLEEVQEFTECENHLPGVPSAQTLVEEQGFDLGKMDATLLQKIEEIHLHLFQMNANIKALTTENAALKNEVAQMRAEGGDRK